MARDPHRFRLTRAGVLNVWQYDEQTFHFADGRLLLRGTNGAGKSKTLEMLLPFVLDGDKARMTATGRTGSQLLWLMSDGAGAGSTRTGYVWVELARTDVEGTRHVLTCGVGIRHSASARQATTWQFTVPGEAPALVEPDGTPLSAPRLRDRVLALDGHVFDSPRAYKQHVGRLLFGLAPQAYDDLLRLLYWLRQPQVGEDLDPRRLVEMLDEALPALDDDAVRQVGEAMDELAEHGARVERLAEAAEAVARSAGVYARYAATTLRDRATAAREAERERASRARAVGAATAELDRVAGELATAQQEQAAAQQALAAARSRVAVLESGPLARNQQVLREKQRRATDSARVAEKGRSSAVKAGERAANSRDRFERGNQELAAQGQRLGEHSSEAASAARSCALEGGLPHLGEHLAHAEALGESVPAVRSRVSTARAAVAVVREAVGVAERRTRARDAAAARAAEAEQREEQAAGRLADADRELARHTDEWVAAATAWLAERDIDESPNPSEPERSLTARVRELLEPDLERWRAQEAAAAADRVSAQARLDELTQRRARVLAERDPSPPAPALARAGRDPSTGLPFWRLIDLRPDTDGALIEAALQASGLLDAQVLTDGVLRLADDTVLGTGPGTGPGTLPVADGAVDDTGTTLDALAPDVPPDSPVPLQVVERVLASIGLVDCDAATSPSIGRDGSWRLGPLTGRASKPAAQYVGSAAREAERARRVAEVDAETEVAAATRDAASAAEEQAATQRVAIQLWLTRLPSAEQLRGAQVRRAERAAERDRSAADATARAGELAAAGTQLVAALTTLRRLCSEHELPEERERLDARDRALSDLDGRLEALAQEAARFRTTARRVEEDGEAAEADADEARSAAVDADVAQRDAHEAEQERTTLLDTLGADVARMQADLDAAQRDSREAVRELDTAGERVLTLTGRRGEGGAQLAAAQVRLDDSVPRVVAAAGAVAGLREVPGLLVAALDRDLDDAEHLGLDAIGHTLGRPAVALLTAWSELAVPRRSDANAVHAEIRTLAAGPAADQEPRVVPVGDELTVLARDPSGAEQPLGRAAKRLAAEVLRERELLTERERALFEEHLLGELGDALRARRAEAGDLVRGMNDLLADVRTSQGIRVRLDWELREDAGTDVRDAVALLGRNRGLLTPEETARLRDALAALIEVARAAEPEQGYAEHLARALDYRRWSVFAVRLQRPGVEGWKALTRRTPLSQGEQKVVCYLPLFAAAAAHFTSVAGAAPHAPRLILLDDAFPKIDVRTHPLLFGLLVDLDLDFVLTSERLWGDHASVPSLSVYEALRAPGERGIAQYHYTWDGTTLVGHG